jgi:hypothetical protein
LKSGVDRELEVDLSGGVARQGAVVHVHFDAVPDLLIVLARLDGGDEVTPLIASYGFLMNGTTAARSVTSLVGNVTGARWAPIRQALCDIPI